MALKISIKNLVKIYFATAHTLEIREAMVEVDLLHLTPDELALLNQDVAELKEAILSLQEILRQAYATGTFEEALPKIMQQINSDPYNRLLFNVADTSEQLPMSAASGVLSDIWRGTTGNDEVN